MTLLATTLVAALALVGRPDPRVIDLNTASLSELRSFPGIGHQYAEKIYRARPFRARAELVERLIMPTAVYLAIKHQLYASPVSAAAGPSPMEPLPAGMVDVNRASRDDLAGIAGIGQLFADRIVRGRPYKSEFELVGRRIIPLATFHKIQSLVGVGR